MSKDGAKVTSSRSIDRNSSNRTKDLQDRSHETPSNNYGTIAAGDLGLLVYRNKALNSCGSCARMASSSPPLAASVSTDMTADA
jgi:hypothetical protein